MYHFQTQAKWEQLTSGRISSWIFIILLSLKGRKLEMIASKCHKTFPTTQSTLALSAISSI